MLEISTVVIILHTENFKKNKNLFSQKVNGIKPEIYVKESFTKISFHFIYWDRKDKEIASFENMLNRYPHSKYIINNYCTVQEYHSSVPALVNF